MKLSTIDNMTTSYVKCQTTDCFNIVHEDIITLFDLKLCFQHLPEEYITKYMNGEV